MKKILVIVLATVLFACNNSKNNESASSGASATTYSVEGKTVKMYTTADSTTLRLSPSDSTLSFKELKQPLETQICVFIDPTRTFQSYIGIGGAITDASAETFYKLPKDKQDELVRAYYDKEKGIGYNVARTNINSCDFSSDMYTYVTDSSKDLKTFSIEHDRKYKIPLIKEAMKAAGGKLNLFASPWSPPSWMKDNNDMLHGGKLKADYADAWALYYTRFIKEYEKEGVPVWAITVQNEPMATQRWESCIFTAEEERDFLKNHLGPVMQKEGLGDKKIMVWDHNRDLIYQRAETYFNDPEAAKYAWGMGFHWYEPWSGGEPMFDNLQRVHEAFPDKHLFFTEGCADNYKADQINSWALGEKYGRNMIHDFNNGMEGFTDWNILLDETGGPNHVGNFCFAPVHGDSKTGQLTYTNSYYYIGHFSKFIQPGAKRIISAPSRSQLLSTAFLNPDGSVVVIVMNQGGAKNTTYLWINGKAAETTVLPHSINTYVIK